MIAEPLQRTLLRQHETSFVTLKYFSDEVLEAHFKNVQITLDMAREILQFQSEVSRGNKVCFLGIADSFTDVDVEARHFMSTPEALAHSKAEAFVLKSLSQRLLGNFYLKFQRPSVPTRLFSNEQEAREWLLSRSN